MRLESLLEHQPCAVDSGSHGSARDAEDLSHFFVTQALDVAEHDGLAITSGYLFERVRHAAADLARVQVLVGQRLQVGKRESLSARILFHRVQAEGALVPDAAPDLVLGQVDRDREDPGGELAALPVALAVAVDAEENLLADLLGAVPVVDEPAHQIHDPRAIPLDERT